VEAIESYGWQASNACSRMKPSRLRAIPSVDKVLQALGDTGLPRPIVLDVVRRELQALRAQKTIPGLDAVVARLDAVVRDVRAARIQPVINGTGILVHTNFGRAPLGTDVIAAVSRIASNYSNLEYSVTGGARGGRAAYLELGLAVLCGAEAATVVNNNAAALVLILRHFCKGGVNEVVISRGELIQIGGGFRIPDVLESSGAALREVGTTNQTSLRDYAGAITRQTALILKVHRSNFFMDGFVKSPLTEDIAALARKKRVVFVEDLGSGAMFETGTVAGLEHEPTPAEVLDHGVDLVCFSGDKLFGGPQAGIIAGSTKLVARLKNEPLFRALRCDKLILSALEATVDAYLRGDPGVAVLEMLRVTNEELRIRAERMIAALNGLPLAASVGTGRAQVGGGTLPRSVVPSLTIDLTHRTLKPQEMASRLRAQTIPLIGYITRGTLKLDLRTIFPRQDHDVVSAIRAASAL
jgi:L-seryl-tRNA(Ser) seleniumtransferase